MSNGSLAKISRVVGVGECVIDVIEKDDQVERVPGGCPMNGVIALSRQGIPTAILSPISSDPDGLLIVEHLKESNVDTSMLKETKVPTTLAILKVGSNGDATYTFEMEGRSQSQWKKEHIYEGPEEGDILLVSGSFSLATQPMSDVFTELFEVGSRYHVIYFDPNVRDRIIGDDPETIENAKKLFDEWVTKSTIVKASSEDVKWRYPDLSLKQAAEKLVGGDERLVFITDSSNPVIVASRRMGIFEVEVEGVDESQIIDTVGAGDTFNSGALKWLIENGITDRDDIVRMDRNSARKLVISANELASQVCLTKGANPPWAQASKAIKIISDDPPTTLAF